MTFLETKDGFSINTDNIEAIEKIDEFTSYIHTKFNKYVANFPYMTLLRMLGGEEKPEIKEPILEKLSKVLDHHQHWAG